MDVNDPYHNGLPPVAASHSDQWLYVSVAATFVHVTFASVTMVLPDALFHVACSRVFSVAGLSVQFSPGFPMWSWMYVAETAKDVLLIVSSSFVSA